MKNKETIECSSCGKDIEIHEEEIYDKIPTAYKLYVGMGSYQYICKECRKLPFDEIMTNLDKGKVYTGNTYKTMEELLNEKRKRKGLAIFLRHDSFKTPKELRNEKRKGNKKSN